MVHYKSLQRKIYNFFLVLVNIVFVCILFELMPVVDINENSCEDLAHILSR